MKQKRKSVLTDDLEHCYLTGSPNIHIHHVFGGPNRGHSEEDGFIVPLHPDMHNMSDKGVHFNRELDLMLKRECQRIYEQTHTRKEFIERYGKSWEKGETESC